MVIEPQKQMASMRASQCEGTMWCLKPSESMCGAIPCKLPVVTVGVDKSDCSNTAAKLFLPKTVTADSHEVTPDTWSAHKLRWDKKWRLYFVAWFLVVPISVAEKHQRLRWSRFGRCMQSCKVSKFQFWVILLNAHPMHWQWLLHVAFFQIAHLLHELSSRRAASKIMLSSRIIPCLILSGLGWEFFAQFGAKGFRVHWRHAQKRGRAERKSEVRMTRWLGSHPLDICMAVLWCKICVQFQILIDSHRLSRQNQQCLVVLYTVVVCWAYERRIARIADLL